MASRKSRTKGDPQWPALRMLFATGKTIDEIAEATGVNRGTIAARCHREHWIEDWKSVQSVVDKATKQTAVVLTDLRARGADWQNRIADQTDKALRVLEDEAPSNLKEVGAFVEVVDKTDRVARRNYGMDQENAASQTIVNLGFLQDYVEKPIRAEIVESPNESDVASATPELLQSPA